MSYKKREFFTILLVSYLRCVIYIFFFGGGALSYFKIVKLRSVPDMINTFLIESSDFQLWHDHNLTQIWKILKCKYRSALFWISPLSDEWKLFSLRIVILKDLQFEAAKKKELEHFEVTRTLNSITLFQDNFFDFFSFMKKKKNFV